MSYLLLAVIFIPFITLLISPLWRRRISGSPKILLLHGIGSKVNDVGTLSLSRFENLLKSIDAAGLSVGSVEESLRDRTKVAITFDDGYDELMLLEPLLSKFRIPITVFVPTAYIGKSNDWDNFLSAGKRLHLNETQIRRLSALGVQFGSHGHTHRDLTKLTDVEIADELTNSKRVLRDLTGAAIIDVAFPFGQANHHLNDTAQKLGYLRQFASVPLADNTVLIGRIAVSILDSGISLHAKLRGNALAGIEVVKGLIICKFSHLTPVVKRS